MIGRHAFTGSLSAVVVAPGVFLPRASDAQQTSVPRHVVEYGGLTS